MRGGHAREDKESQACVPRCKECVAAGRCAPTAGSGPSDILMPEIAHLHFGLESYFRLISRGYIDHSSISGIGSTYGLCPGIWRTETEICSMVQRHFGHNELRRTIASLNQADNQRGNSVTSSKETITAITGTRNALRPIKFIQVYCSSRSHSESCEWLQMADELSMGDESLGGAGWFRRALTVSSCVSRPTRKLYRARLVGRRLSTLGHVRMCSTQSSFEATGRPDEGV